MTAPEIRQSFLDFFESKDHRIVPSAPVIPHGDPTLLFTNAGMNQFKDVFLGSGKRDYSRAADTQKCIRVSGKHNDLEEVGRDTYHHTFFEMLGNWSFGDYYKKEAIGWAWELLTAVWGLEKRRLYATVYETDDEAEKLWRTVTDIDPSHVLRFGKKDNFWEMGETGPCGPCSEIHIDQTKDLSGGRLVNAGDPRVMEIWNLVFIQNNRNEKGELETLPAKHVDTGMGFERICAVLQGKTSNYDTDVFTTIINRISQLVGKAYTAKLDSSTDIAMRVIADHIRMLTFSITDGAIPGNEGRGYVLRRILRRAARFGRNLGTHEPFIYTVTDAVVQSMGEAFPEIVEKQAHVERVVKSEEESFNATLDRGLEIFESVTERIGHSRVFPGEDAFKLYDTYGFPLDLTQLMAEERGLKVDVVRFTELMEEQRGRSRVGTSWTFRGEDEAGEETGIQQLAGSLMTRFTGYPPASLDQEVTLLKTVATKKEAGDIDQLLLFVDTCPFYAQSGGQVSDTGWVTVEGQEFRVIDTRKIGNAYALAVDPKLAGNRQIEFGFDTPMPIRVRVEAERRTNIQRNHSATHLVHEALRRILGAHVHQQGSLVAPDHLRFDFPHFGKITPEEIRAIEDVVNEKVAEDIPVFTEVDMPIEQARKIPNVKMFFGDKYGDVVRVVFIDKDFSVEFCGGTHVGRTHDIGVFKIISESSIASGVRRVEAVTGKGVQRYIEEQLAKAQHVDDQLSRLIEEKEILERELNKYTQEGVPSGRPSLGTLTLTGDKSPQASLAIIEDHLKNAEEAIEQVMKQSSDLKKELSRHRIQAAASNIDALVDRATSVNGFKVVSAQINAEDIEELKSLGDELRSKLKSGVGVLASIIDEKVALVCVVTDDLIKEMNLQAGRIVGEVAKQVGGGGGGRPHMATAGGKDVQKLSAALQQTPGIIQALLSH